MSLSSWSFNWEDFSVNEYRVQSLPRGEFLISWGMAERFPCKWVQGPEFTERWVSCTCSTRFFYISSFVYSWQYGKELIVRGELTVWGGADSVGRSWQCGEKLTVWEGAASVGVAGSVGRKWQCGEGLTVWGGADSVGRSWQCGEELTVWGGADSVRRGWLGRGWHFWERLTVWGGAESVGRGWQCGEGVDSVGEELIVWGG